MKIPTDESPAEVSAGPLSAESIIIRGDSAAEVALHAERLAALYGCHSTLIDPEGHGSAPRPGTLLASHRGHDLVNCRGIRSLDLRDALRDLAMSIVGDRPALEVLRLELASVEAVVAELAGIQTELAGIPARREAIIQAAAKGKASASFEESAADLAKTDSLAVLLAGRRDNLKITLAGREAELAALTRVASEPFGGELDELDAAARRSARDLLSALVDRDSEMDEHQTGGWHVMAEVARLRADLEIAESGKRYSARDYCRGMIRFADRLAAGKERVAALRAATDAAAKAVRTIFSELS